MTTRNELTILQRSIEKAIANGYLQESGLVVNGVNIIVDPPTVHISLGPDNPLSSSDLYLDPLFPIFERDWAICFFGRELTGDAFFGLMPAWRYHQHKLLEFLQNSEMEEFYKYLEVYI